MSSRNSILSAVKQAQPEFQPLPDLAHLHIEYSDNAAHYTAILEGIGGKLVPITSEDELVELVPSLFPTAARIVSTIPELASIAETKLAGTKPHALENVDLAIIRGVFGVAENGAVWITENESQVRALPYITQHLAVVLQRSEIVANMHQAYERIGLERYPFGGFIAGPSKTADIEQSLVLGAHGAKSMTIFLVG